MSEYQLCALARRIFTRPGKRYLSYLRSPEWHSWNPEGNRARALRRANWTCQICKIHPAVHVHHWEYSRLGNERPEDLCAVCLWCHNKLHAYLVPEAANDNQQTQYELPLKKA